MTPLLAMLPLLLAAADAPADAPERATAVSVDGGSVPIVAPGLTPGVAKVLAPELVSDGGETIDGGVEAIVAPPSLSVYDVDLPAEAAITAGSFGLYFMVDVLIKPSLQGNAYCGGSGIARCDPADLSGFDRYAVGKNSAPWGTFSDVAMVSSFVIPIIYLGLESLTLPTKTPWRDFATDLLVITESLAFTAGFDTVLKFAFRRPRPSRYIESTAPTTPFDQELSLPSGHSAMVAAATTALTTTIFLRHPDSKVRYVFLTGGIVLSLMVGLARVESGNHFPTDCITGLLVGGFAGFAIPYLHRKKFPVTPSVAFNPVTGSAMFGVAGNL